MSIFYLFVGTHFKSQTQSEFAWQIKRSSKLFSLSCIEETSYGGVWQAVSLCSLLAHASIHICIRLKGGLKHQSLFEAPLDAAQWDRLRKTIYTALLRTTVPRMQQSYKNKSGTHQCHNRNNKPLMMCFHRTRTKVIFFYILSLRKLWYFCISEDFCIISVNTGAR